MCVIQKYVLCVKTVLHLCCLLSDGVQIESPLHTVDFLNDFHQILQSKFTAATMDQCLDPAGTSRI